MRALLRKIDLRVQIIVLLIAGVTLITLGLAVNRAFIVPYLLIAMVLSVFGWKDADLVGRLLAALVWPMYLLLILYATYLQPYKGKTLLECLR